MSLLFESIEIEFIVPHGVLYSRGSKGEIRTWWMETKGQFYRTHSGILDGQIVVSEWKEAVGKNIGKANETLPRHQALSEVESRYKKQLKSGYFKDIKDIDVVQFFQPQLAQDYKKRGKKKLPEKMACQPKLDGMRNCGQAIGSYSRTGEKFFTAPHIEAILAPIFEKYPDEKITFDGEFYNHEYKADFDSLSSAIRKQKPTQDEMEQSIEVIEYHIYDIHFGNRPDMPFTERYTLLRSLFEEFGLVDNPKVRLVETTFCTTEAELDKKYEEYLEAGYEGQMIRDANSAYENKRTWSLMKRKEFYDGEWVLIRIEEGRGNWAGKARKGYFLHTDGTEFKADIVGTRARCQYILENQDEFLGKPTTIVYQQLTPRGVPRFGKVKELARKDI